MQLFERDRKVFGEPPLSVRLRPANLSDFVGQRHIVGEGKLLRRAIEADRLGSLIFYGPPGCGKTALAHVIASTTKHAFEKLNAVTAGVNEIRIFLKKAQQRLKLQNKKTILLIEEIHRFNKPQQDALLPDVEEGIITLIGTTTLNPFFSISSPLISRSQIFEFFPLSKEDIKTIVEHALNNKEKGFGSYKIDLSEDALEFLITTSDGDARKALNALELAVLTTQPDKNGTIKLDLKVIEDSIQKKAVVYDRNGDAHYDTISAFIKSLRGSDPDASLYWLAKMLYAGEDPRFIARRLVVAAAEDVGCADPIALLVATSAFHAVEFIGMPEAQIPLAEATVYIAASPKSNACYKGISSAMSDIQKEATQKIPNHLRDSHYPGAKVLGHGEGYKYPHSFKDHWVKQSYLERVKQYYFPTSQGKEKEIKERLSNLLRKKDE
jgi:putative ATPase